VEIRKQEGTRSGLRVAYILVLGPWQMDDVFRKSVFGGYALPRSRPANPRLPRLPRLPRHHPPPPTPVGHKFTSYADHTSYDDDKPMIKTVSQFQDISYAPLSKDRFHEFDFYVPPNDLYDTPANDVTFPIICFVHGGAWRS
jgi:hypothetical protein